MFVTIYANNIINNYPNLLQNKIDLRDRVNGNLVTLAVHFLHGRVVGVLVGDEVGGFDVATVGILTFPVEYILVQFDVVVVDGVVERDRDHLRHVFGG